MEELLEPLNVLMISDTVGGVWTYSIELCKALLPFNIKFYLVTTGAALQSHQKKEVEALNNVKVYETNFMLEWMQNSWQNIDSSASCLLQLEDKLKPHIIHSNSFVYGSSNWKAPVVVVAHSDVFSWYASVKNILPPAEWDEYYKRVKQGLDDADFIVAPSNWMMQQVRMIYKTSTNGKVIYNGRSAHIFQPKQKQAYVFSMGRIWDEAKNIQLLADAAPRINYTIKLAGDNSFDNNHALTTTNNICYSGRLSSTQIAAELSSASVYVLPAKYEPFGLSVLEAALSGCALVLGKINSLKEIWKDNAMYVDVNNANALAKTINNLMQNEAMRNHYAKAAMQQAKKYDTKAMAESYLQLYKHLIQ